MQSSFPSTGGASQVRRSERAAEGLHKVPTFSTDFWPFVSELSRMVEAEFLGLRHASTRAIIRQILGREKHRPLKYLTCP
jgi:hypothetical protein